MLHESEAYRSFPSVRMTRLRIAVILTEGKDLYIMSTNSIWLVRQLSVMNRALGCEPSRAVVE